VWCASELLEAHWRRTCGALTAESGAASRQAREKRASGRERVISSVYGTAPAKGDSRRERASER